MLFKAPLISIFWIDDSSFCDFKNCFIFCQARRVENFANSLLSFSFPEVQSGCTGMSQNMSSDRFLGINMGHCVSRISHDLVRHKHGNVELLRQLQEPAQNLSQDLLPLCKFSSSSVIRSEDSHDRVNDQKRMRAFHHEACCKVEKCDQMFDSVTSGVLYVFKGLLSVQTESLSNLLDSLRSERSFSINVDDFSISSSFLFG